MNATGTVLSVHIPGGDGGGVDALEAEFDVVVADGVIDAMKRLSTSPAPDCLVTPASPGDLGFDGFLAQVRSVAPDVAVVVVGEPPADAAALSALVEADAYVPPGREDALSGRVRRLVAEGRVERSVDRHDRLARAVASVAVDVAGGQDRQTVEAAFHDRLLVGDWYRHVWVGRRDDAGELTVSFPVAGRLGEDELATLVGTDEGDFLSRAVETGQVVATAGRVAVRRAAPFGVGPRGDGRDRDELATAAVPFLHDGQVRGVGIVATDRSDAFDGAERELLADLGAIIGHALAGVDVAGADDPSPHLARGMENLVHDLRNPLGIARSHLEIAREDDEPASLERVAAALDRMVDTVDRVAAGVSGEPGIEPSRDDLASAAAVAWGVVETDSATLEVVDSATIRADHDLLVRLLSNLFQNAVDHAGESVTVRVGTMSAGFYVEDDGAGIPRAERESVVERGYSTAEDGLGIGLSIVQDVAAAHGWTLTVTEAPGGGARFELSGIERVEERTT